MMNTFKHVVTRKSDGEEVYKEIKTHLDCGEIVIIDFSEIDTMTTYFAKQVFGRLYIELGEEGFADKMKFDKRHMSDDVELVLKIGIDGAIESSNKEINADNKS